MDAAFSPKDAADKRPSILIDAAHHARELTSVSMVMYTMLRMLHGYLNDDQEIKSILATSGVFFVPIVNLDSYSRISSNYALTNQLEMIRKNQRDTCGFKDNVGVDLNRNYAYKWGFDDLGSSKGPCEEDYRGSGPFSEPETQAIRYFVESHPLLRIALNFHAWGNLLVTPFNYSNDTTASELNNKYPGAAAFYDDIWTNGGMPNNNVKGSGIITVQYTANGEASDWMLNEHGIYAMSPELGSSSSRSDMFWITDVNSMKDLLE